MLELLYDLKIKYFIQFEIAAYATTEKQKIKNTKTSMPSDLKRIKCLSITKAIQQMYKMASKQFE